MVHRICPAPGSELRHSQGIGQEQASPLARHPDPARDPCPPGFPGGPEGMGQKKSDIKTAFANLLYVGLNPTPARFHRDPLIEQVCIGKQWLQMPPTHQGDLGIGKSAPQPTQSRSCHDRIPHPGGNTNQYSRACWQTITPSGGAGTSSSRLPSDRHSPLKSSPLSSVPKSHRPSTAFPCPVHLRSGRRSCEPHPHE